MYVRIGLLLVVGCLLLTVAGRSLAFVGAVLAGAAAGVALALWGAARTTFAWEANRLYYVPHTYTGVAVSLLFLGRLIYRLVQVYPAMHAQHDALAAKQSFNSPAMLRSPLTLGLFFVLVGYYVCYYIVVLRKAKLVPATAAEPAGV